MREVLPCNVANSEWIRLDKDSFYILTSRLTCLAFPLEETRVNTKRTFELLLQQKSAILYRFESMYKFDEWNRNRKESLQGFTTVEVGELINCHSHFSDGDTRVKLALPPNIRKKLSHSIIIAHSIAHRTYMHISNFRLHISSKKMINKTILGDQLHTSSPTMSKLEIAFNYQKCKII